MNGFEASKKHIVYSVNSTFIKWGSPLQKVHYNELHGIVNVISTYQFVKILYQLLISDKGYEKGSSNACFSFYREETALQVFKAYKALLVHQVHR